MRDDIYKLAGTVRVSEDKKDEFNRYILKILDVCGIRKTENIKLGGQRLRAGGFDLNQIFGRKEIKKEKRGKKKSKPHVAAPF